jgi:hypothetical protein
MLETPQARRRWRRYVLRVELNLSSLSPGVRRELVEDLSAHVRAVLTNDGSSASEAERLNAALRQLGDPKEFLAPLIAEAVFRDPARDTGPVAALRSLAAHAARGWRFFRASATVAAASILAAGMLIVGAGSLIRPGSIGVFRLSPDEYQMRLFGGDGGQLVLWPWLGLSLAAFGGVVAWLAWRRARSLVVEVLASVD